MENNKPGGYPMGHQASIELPVLRDGTTSKPARKARAEAPVRKGAVQKDAAQEGRTAADLELVRRVQQGEKGAFDLLVRKYQHKIVRLVERYVHDQVECLDVAQEVFLKAYRAIDNFRGDSAFYTWLYRIAINTARNHLAATGRRVTLDYVDGMEDDYATPRDYATPEKTLMGDDVRQAVWEAIDGLTNDLRQAIILREIELMSYEEIAQVMDCPVGTVRSRIFRAREVIENKLRPLLS